MPLIQQLRKMKDYFSEYKQQVKETNILILRQVVIFTTIAYIILMVVTPIVLSDWHITPEYLMMIPVLLLFGVAAFHLSRHKQEVSLGFVQFICYAFYLLFLLIIMFIDVFPYSDTPSNFFPLVIEALPVIFNAIVGLIFSLIIAYIVLKIRTQNGMVQSKLEEKGSIDYLTGILNKGTFESNVQDYFSRKSESLTSALLIIDLDDFKMVNDKLGHQKGDEMLTKMGTILTSVFRSNDMLGRVGGDEFAVLMCNINGVDAIERRCIELLEKVHSIEFEPGWRFSCSIGVAVSDGNMLYHNIFKMADDALYEAKTFGKGRHVVHISRNINSIKDKKIMIIADDEESIRTALKLEFQEEYEVVETKDGNEVLSILSEYENRVEIVLLDLYMPDTDGYEVLKYMKSRRKYEDIPIVVITSDAQSEEKVLRMGAADMIEKPIDPQIIKLRIRNILGNK